MANEAVPVDTSSSPAINNSPPLATNAAGDDPLERSSSVSEEYLRYLENPQNSERLFPVDRKKLEKLIVAGKDTESAEKYFERIMRETNTLILWPSKLKIGAKSKKDPQVKVIGLPVEVQKARELILQDLDSKSNRVTLKIDVAYSEHSHVIGKEGANIKKVHKETKCHIHFPDSNRFYGPKNNQVSVTGPVTGVEAARQNIRELLPVVVTFTLPMPGHIDPNSQEVKQMMVAYNVSIHIKPQPKNCSMLVVMRGTMKFVDGLKLAITKIVEYFTGDYHYVPMVSLALDINHQHHRTLLGGGGGNIRKIMEETHSTIQFPDPQSRFHSNQVTVNGTTDAVFKAREQVLGCLPVVLMFDVHETEENSLNSAMTGELSEQLDVYISVKSKQKQRVQSVIIKSIEQNLQCVYQARLRMLECSNQPGLRATPTATPISAGEDLQQKLSTSGNLGNMPQATSSGIHGDKAPPSLFSPITEEDPGNLSSLPDSPSSANEGGSLLDSQEILGLKPVTPEFEASYESRASDLGAPPRDDSLSPIEMARSQSFTTPSKRQKVTTPPRRPTMKAFIDWDKKKEAAQKAMKSKVEPNVPRYPTSVFGGGYFSESMPVRGKEKDPADSYTSAMPQGLSSINRSGNQALLRQASAERTQTLHELHTYRDVHDLPMLLERLGLEHYLEHFKQEEVDFETFLTMTEADLMDIKITKLGARRKLQIAISELNKNHSKEPAVVATGFSPNRGLYPNSLSPPPPAGAPLSKSGSMKQGKFSMSHSGRF